MNISDSSGAEDWKPITLALTVETKEEAQRLLALLRHGYINQFLAKERGQRLYEDAKAVINKFGEIDTDNQFAELRKIHLS